MLVSDFKTETKKDFKGNLVDVVIYYTACEYRWEESANPEISQLEYFLSEEEAIEYAKNLDCEIGFYPKVEKVTIEKNFIDIEEDQEFELDEITELVPHNGSWIDIDEVYAGAENGGNTLEGSIIVEWSWEKYVGYCRNLIRIGYAGQWPFENFKDQSDLISGNEERTFNSNYSILIDASDIEGLDNDEINELIEDKINESHWKWNSFKNNPNTVDITL